MPFEFKNITRREIIGSLSTGIAVAALGSSNALAQTAAKTGEARKAEPLQNPLTKYPKPPFKSQSQPWPGLASKMQPRPDHGEKSYIGSGRLLGRKALITGGDSGIGRAAAIAYAREGADVAVIIGTTSVQAENPSADLYDYAQTKAATTNYIRSLAKQLGPKGIRVNGVAPGALFLYN